MIKCCKLFLSFCKDVQVGFNPVIVMILVDDIAQSSDE